MRVAVSTALALGLALGAYACASTPNTAAGAGGAAQASTGPGYGTTAGGCTHEWELQNDACCPDAPCCGLDATVATGCGKTVSTGPMPCDSIGICEGSNAAPDPGKDCYDCVFTPGTTFTDEGSCASAALAAYGSDGKCAMGGVQGACDFVACSNKCFANDPTGQMQTSWDCYCTNTEMGAASTCIEIPSLQAAQTDIKTCVGALVANSAAFDAEVQVDSCWEDACVQSCNTLGTSAATSTATSAQSSTATSTSTASASSSASSGGSG